jgi:Na+/melibiose symporter-like transporter
MRRLIIGVVGVVLCLIGALWVGQGTGAVHGSAMTGHSQWTYIGIVLIVLGVAALVVAVMRSWAR